MVFRQNAFCAARHNDRRVQFLGEQAQLVLRVRVKNSGTRENQRTLRLADSLNGIAQRSIVRIVSHRTFNPRGDTDIPLTHNDIHREFQHRRTRAARAHRLKGVLNDDRNFCDGVGNRTVFGERLKKPHLIQPVEHLVRGFAVELRMTLPGDKQDRGTIGERL